MDRYVSSADGITRMVVSLICAPLQTALNLNDRLAEQKGSISAEHGLGVSKNKFLHYSKSGPMIHLMKTIKQLIDPNGIMNPYKVISFWLVGDCIFLTTF